jgi:hypothetical protein
MSFVKRQKNNSILGEPRLSLSGFALSPMTPQGELRSPLTPPLKETYGFLFLLRLTFPYFRF